MFPQSRSRGAQSEDRRIGGHIQFAVVRMLRHMRTLFSERLQSESYRCRIHTSDVLCRRIVHRPADRGPRHAEDTVEGHTVHGVLRYLQDIGGRYVLLCTG